MNRILRFRRDSSGNIAVIFALLLLPLLEAVGCAVDLSVAMKQRTRIQAALDDAVLAVRSPGSRPSMPVPIQPQRLPRRIPPPPSSLAAIRPGSPPICRPASP
jgi:Putative Flp pilus-assembly TadE/G-like